MVITTEQGKTFYMQPSSTYSIANGGTPTSVFFSDLWLGGTLNAGRLKLSQYGDITSSGGNLTLKNNAGSTSASITKDGYITAATVNCQNGIFGALTTNANEVQTIDGTSINIGHLTTTSYTNVNVLGVLYVNGVPLVPWSSATSFFSQW